MRLTLSTGTPWKSTYHTDEGQAIYKTESSGCVIGARVIKVSRIDAPTAPTPILDDSKTLTDGDTMRDTFSELAQIDYHYYRTSRFKIGGQDMASTDFFRRGGFNMSFLGRNRVFLGPDGREYVWKLDHDTSRLYRNDGSDTVIAVYNGHSLGWFIGKGRPSTLDIYPAGEHISDIIIVTFVFIEKLRTDKKRTQRHQRGSGGGP